MLFNVFGISHAQLRVILIFWVFFSRFHLVLYNEELLVLFSFCCFCVQKYAGAGIFVSFAEATAQRKREAEKFEKFVTYAPYPQVSTLRLVTDLPVVNQLKPLLKVEKFVKFVVAYAPYPQVSTLRLVTDLPVVNQINP